MTNRQRLAQLDKAVAELKETLEGFHPDRPHWKKAMALINGVRQDLRGSRVPALGPIYRGGQSVLLYSPTHETAGLEWPAFDAAMGHPGRDVLAPESGVVYKQSSAQGGDAFYFKGDSKIEYWVGHTASSPQTGHRFKKGQKMAVIGNIPRSFGGPHVHLGLNVRPLTGRHLKYGRTGHGPDYTHGAPKIGVQLATMLDS